MHFRFLFLLGTLVFCFSHQLRATIIYVDSAHVGGTQNGTSWATAFSNFQNGINAANAGDSVWVAKGTYRPPVNSSFAMKEGVKIFGGFLANNASFLQRNWRTNKTVLRGNMSSVILNDTNNLTPAAQIDGFTITEGSSQALGAGYGGGIKNTFSSPTIVNCTFTLNVLYGSANYIGAALYNGFCAPIINNCIFERNWTTEGSGGAIYNLNASPTITNCVFAKNSVGGYGLGGAIYNSNSSPKFTNCTFVRNVSSPVGGGAGAAMYSVGASSPILNNCIVWGNIIDNSGGWGSPVGSGLYGGLGGLYYSLVQGFAASTNLHVLAGSTNPLFVDTAAGNYRLQANSPCINMGNNDTIPAGITKDLAGNARIYGLIVDMGAYEFQLPPSVNLGQDTVLCMGDTLTLNAQDADATYLWNTGDTTSTISVVTSGTYYVTATNSVGIDRDTILVTFNPSPIIHLGNDTAICIGTPIDLTLDAENIGASFLWNTDSISQTLQVTTPGTYYVSVTNSYLCTSSDTIHVSIADLPVLDLGEDTVICSGNPLILDAQNPGATYLWSTADTTQTIGINATGIYSVDITDINGCKGYDTIQVTANPSPIVDLGNDVTTNASSYTIDAGNTGASYLWSTGATTQTITVTTNGGYYVTVTNMNNCNASDTIQVTFGSTGIDDDWATKSNVRIYPNPAKEVMVIDITKAMHLLHTTISLTDVTGRIVKTFNLESNTKIYSLSGLNNGLYFLRTYDGSSFKILKH